MVWVLAQEPVRYKLKMGNRVIRQMMIYKYQGIEITSECNLCHETTNQELKAAIISGTLWDIIWRNKYLQPKYKTRICKNCVHSVMTYNIRIRADNVKTEWTLRVANVIILTLYWRKQDKIECGTKVLERTARSGI